MNPELAPPFLQIKGRIFKGSRLHNYYADVIL
jgi:hypothetical protein